MASTIWDQVLSWRSVAGVLVLFGLAPGFALRVIVLAYHREDPIRDELIAELYAVPWFERPLWVAQQLETAICEGLRDRIVWAATGRIIERWSLGDGVEQNRLYPDTFEVPSAEEKAGLVPGDKVKAMFEVKLLRRNQVLGQDRWGERMWLEVIKVKRRSLVCRLTNQPAGIPRLEFGDIVKIRLKHVIDIRYHDVDYRELDAKEAARFAELYPDGGPFRELAGG